LEAEPRTLEEVEKIRIKSLCRDLERIWAIEEIKIRQRSRDRTILEGDRNSAYFHAVANYRHRKKEYNISWGLGGWSRKPETF
jgi:hypothetical protein